jgi:hypothetical protein
VPAEQAHPGSQSNVAGVGKHRGQHAVEDKIHVNELHAANVHLFGFDHLKLTYRFQGRDYRLTDVAGKVVPKLLA